MREDWLSAHRFRWIAGMLILVIGVLTWQNWQMRTDLNRMNRRIEKAVEAANKASEYAWQTKNQVRFDDDDRRELERLRDTPTVELESRPKRQRGYLLP